MRRVRLLVPLPHEGLTEMPAHALATDPDMGRYAIAYRCGDMPVVIAGGDLEGLERRAVVAHELAHHTLGHTSSTAGSRLMYTALVAAGAALGTALTAPALAAYLGLCAAAGFLASRAISRKEELDADRTAVVDLDAQGLPGRDLTLAVIRAVPADPRWARWGGWVLCGHPTVLARVAAIAR